MHNCEVGVVIPIYKPQFSEYELIALKQCLAVLKNYPIIIIKPNSLVAQSVYQFGEKVEIISYHDDFFASIHGYNKLMLSEEFYRSFSKYKFILIHQLDAFVFSDQLAYWCNQGYDYIGAPWVSNKVYPHFLARLKARIKNYLYVRYNAKQKDGMPKTEKQLENRVGNGGFSLRRVEIFHNLCMHFKPAIEKYLVMQHPCFNEDIFWSIEMNRKKKHLKLPGFKKALKFAFETNPEIAIEKNNGQLPFGCHAWDKNITFWKPVFKKYNYNI